MLFNTKEEWPFQEIHEQTVIVEKYLECALLPLAMGNMTPRILFKEPENSNIQLSNFHVNDSFASKSHTANLEKSENSLKKKQIRKIVESDHAHEIDAAIIRIMKTSNTVRHLELIAEFAGHKSTKSTLKVCLRATKSRIEHLIESDFLSRSKDDTYVVKINDLF
ncbi:unnamed protein product [Rotaria socialis]|uniref:Cullin neddylation domain-containing protein n=2 Tax=Rotaria socialis TaxID=392032 RepID=A0A820D2Q0_9BILA|nr:unnamed protein product [Rotaria socialis]CAF4224585.1 unnamed protein product [Rotaria socialis]CAF4492062.1 unnamed protein product [Rotaria socialis]